MKHRRPAATSRLAGPARAALPAIILVLAATAATPASTAAQDRVTLEDPATLQGVVGDDQTMSPIAGARVTLLDLDQETETDANGRFAFSDAPLGPISVRVEIPGYVSMTEDVEVTADEIQFVQFFVPNLSAMLDELRVPGERARDRVRAHPADGTNATALDLLAGEALGVRQGSGTVGDTGFSILPRGVRSLTRVGEPTVFLNGARVGGPQRAIDVLREIPAEDVEEIQVLRGPAAAFLDASFASEGVIHVTTKSGAPR